MYGPYKTHYVCPPCRWAVKRQPRRDGEAVPKCALCLRPMIDAGRDLAVPRRTDKAGWRALAAVLESGVYFHSCGCGGPGFRPRTPAQVRERRAAADRLGVPPARTMVRPEPYEEPGT